MFDVVAVRKDCWLFFNLSSFGFLPSLSILNPQPTSMAGRSCRSASTANSM